MGKRNLIYLRLEDISNCFKNQEINFSDKYDCNFNSETGELKIDKKESFSNLYFENFNVGRINLIVGENGSGKSTVLDVLASTYEEKLGIIKNRKFSRWFAIYDIEEDPYSFIIEACMFWKFQNILWEKNSIGLEKHFLKKISYLNNNQHYQFKETEILSEEHEKVAYIYSKVDQAPKVDLISRDSKHNDYVYSRNVISDPSIINMIEYIDEVLDKDQNRYKGIGLKVNFKLKNDDKYELFNINKNSEKYQEIIKNIYNLELFEKNSRKSNFDAKERFIIEYLESIAYQIEKNNISKEKVSINKPDLSNFESRIKFLTDKIDDSTGSDSRSKVTRKSVIEMMDITTKNNFFRKDEISIPIIRDSFIRFKILKFLKNEIHKEWFPFDVTLSTQSSGETQFIKNFSNIYRAVNDNLKKNVTNIIILLDEPDTSFHPEWSRRYISILNDILGKFSSEVNFQVVITTHSPFLVSDIPKDFITLISIKNYKTSELERIIDKPVFGLMSNIYDLIKNSFFMEKPTGELAAKYFTGLKKEIDLLNVKDLNYEQSTLEVHRIIQKINLIDDPLIKKMLRNYLKDVVGKSSVSNNKNEQHSEIEKLQNDMEKIRLKLQILES